MITIDRALKFLILQPLSNLKKDLILPMPGNSRTNTDSESGKVLYKFSID